MLYSKKINHPKSNQWVVFIHGAGGSSAIWHKQIKPFSNLYNILLVDLRGHGKSKLKSEKKDYSFEVISRDVAEVMNSTSAFGRSFNGIDCYKTDLQY